MANHFTVTRQSSNVAFIDFFRRDIDANALSEPVLRELEKIIDELSLDNSVQGIVIASTRPSQFIAGADIGEIESMRTAAEASEGSRQMQALFVKIANCRKPTVAAIHGACLGGGLELALACRWRVVSDDSSTVLGLPEIQLGIIPGAGGTQRLPRLVGLQAGLEMVLTGKRIKADKAVKMGLADVMVHPSLLRKIAEDYARKSQRTTRGKPVVQRLLEDNPMGRGIMIKKAREQVMKSTKGFYPAAFGAVQAVFQGYSMSMDKGLELEAKIFGDLAMTRESNSLIHLFHATTHIKKHPYKDAGKAVFGDQSVQRIGIIGGGFMGTGIATICVDKKIAIRMSDPSKIALGRSLNHIRDYLKKKVKRRQLKSFELEQRIAMVSPATSPQGFGSCDIVIEAVFEDLKLKQNLLQQTEKNAGKHWIFASNTSAIPISKIAASSNNPDRVLGMHFFSPVEKMPLLEVVITDKTAPWATSRAIEVGQTMGKQVIVVRDGPGFYTTRALAFYLHEGALMLAEGARMDKLDKALMDFGFPVGPITLIDEVGIDVGAHVLETMAASFPSRIGIPESLNLILESKRLGRKNSKGFYLYADGKKGDADPEIYTMLTRYKVSPKGIPSDEMVDRCLLVFVNESARCLEEKILAHPHDGDVGAVFGLGFPPVWGGPFKYVDHIGAKIIVDRLQTLADRYGERFKPADILHEYARSGKKFFPDEVTK
jgi:3-hydroxyacyl-CoA dehydrogenase/enoyl-CoA hydratase/3-hydroxybutyryl-CoA epimerase